VVDVVAVLTEQPTQDGARNIAYEFYEDWPGNIYTLVPGEVEARNVEEQRLDMTAEERRNSTACETEDTGRDIYRRV